MPFRAKRAGNTWVDPAKWMRLRVESLWRIRFSESSCGPPG
jgi:hypothetical protein